MVAEKHQYSDSAKESTLNANVGAADSTMTLQDGSTFPGGGAAGKVVCTIDPDLPSEERIRYTSRTGNTLNVVERGYGQGGTGQAHSAGATVRHSLSAVEMGEAHDHVTDTTKDEHCFSEDTELLTEVGWLGIDAVEPDLRAWTFDPATERAALDRIDAVWRYDVDKHPTLVSLRTQDLGEVLVTPEHTMVWRRANAKTQRQWSRRPALSLPKQFSIPASARGHDETVDLTDDQVALLAWATTEGYVHPDGPVTIAQKNGPLADRLRSILDRLGHPYREYKGRGDMRSFRVRSGFLTWAMDDEKVPRWELTCMSSRQAHIFIAEAILGDGSVSGGQDKLALIDEWLTGGRQPHMTLAAKSDRYIDFVQTLCVLNGIKSRDYTDPDGFHRLAIKMTREHSFACGASPTAIVEQVPNDHGRVWCVTVPTHHTVIARRPGSAPFIAGNTQYHNTARHAAVVHTAGMLGTDSVTADKIIAGAVGSAELGAGAVIAGKIAAGGVSAANQLAAGVVDAAAILDGAVGTAEIATDAVTADEIFAGAVGSAELAASAVIAGKVAAGGVSATNQIADAIITLAKFASEAGTTYASGNPFNNVTLGTGGVSYGRYFKLGRLVVVLAGFQLGTGGNVTGVIELSLPFTAANISGFTGSDASTGGFAACRAFDPGGGNVRQSGTGVTAGSTCTNFATAGVNATWDANTPWDWNADDKFQNVIVYEATA